MNTSKKDLRKIFLDKSKIITNEKYKKRSLDRHLRHMRKRLYKEFDQTWIKYNNNQATYQQWENALDKWLNSELI
tara:strand:- start:286 stop:510 length:225 start_codon:yes stop_codon:yes gene_type:complete